MDRSREADARYGTTVLAVVTPEKGGHRLRRGTALNTVAERRETRRHDGLYVPRVRGGCMMNRRRRALADRLHTEACRAGQTRSILLRHAARRLSGSNWRAHLPILSSRHHSAALRAGPDRALFSGHAHLEVVYHLTRGPASAADSVGSEVIRTTERTHHCLEAFERDPSQGRVMIERSASHDEQDAALSSRKR